MVGFSDFKFLSGTNEVNTLSLEVTGGYTTGFSVIIYNKEPLAKTYKLGFVDAGKTNDALAQPACLGTNETSNFGQYVTGSTSLFTLPAGGSATKNLSIQFPESYSGVYHGCIMFFPSTTDGSTDMNTLPRRGGFIDVLVHPSAVTVAVKAFPSNRIYQATNNANTGILKIYASDKTLIYTSLPFTLNSEGTGEALISAPAGTYYMVFKGQSHLASYLSGVLIGGTGGEFFDFTTGSNLYGAQNFDSQTNDGKKYQTAGDLKNDNGLYDFTINGNDITIITKNGFQESGIDVLDPRNLNGDTAINISDISVIGANFDIYDPFFDDFNITRTFNW